MVSTVRWTSRHLLRHLAHAFVSPVGLPKPIKRVHHNIPVHHRIQHGRIKYVSSPPLHASPSSLPAVAASFMNTVILTSVFSAGNHALFAGTRVLYGLSVVSPRRQAPAIFSKTTPAGIPIFALLATSSVSILCFASSFVGSGQLWGWLQNIVGVSNQVSPTLPNCAQPHCLQIAWLSIGLTSYRFRKAWVAQGRSVNELKFYVRWTWPWGPYFVVCCTTFNLYHTLMTS